MTGKLSSAALHQFLPFLQCTKVAVVTATVSVFPRIYSYGVERVLLKSSTCTYVSKFLYLPLCEGVEDGAVADSRDQVVNTPGVFDTGCCFVVVLLVYPFQEFGTSFLLPLQLPSACQSRLALVTRNRNLDQYDRPIQSNEFIKKNQSKSIKANGRVDLYKVGCDEPFHASRPRDGTSTTSPSLTAER